MIGQAAIAKAGVLAGSAVAVASINGSGIEWFIDPRHASAVALGLAAAFFFRLSVVVHAKDDASIWREVSVNLLAFVANFILAASITSTLATQKPPSYLGIALAAVLIGATGTTAIRLAAKEFLKRIIGGEGKD
jgi:hypothetical protein